MREIEDILTDINSFEPIDDDWLELDDLIGELLESNNPENGIRTLLNVLERFPEEDGAGVLWSIVHGLEHLDGYEQELIDSLLRQPSLLGVAMVRRIENTGQTEIAGRKVEEIYGTLLSHPKLPESVKDYVVDYKK
ncbi:hypothetical protein [Rufibacter latericius]|uniref:Immunity protein 30 domain-containing protein n=1 Tax=Rufibacter latericius TaxID=2487040 RepID=A0A3M9MTQ1_9BACT|nr:hypothetical protein [Rufibacter latericius]RNI28565.1 hypothetical protein EFB08_07945 [Rufibacter latericius]